MSLTDEITEHVRNLAPGQQASVLAFARSLGTPRASIPRGASLEQLLAFAKRIPEDDLRQMEEAIEEGCERVDGNGW